MDNTFKQVLGTVISQWVLSSLTHTCFSWSRSIQSCVLKLCCSEHLDMCSIEWGKGSKEQQKRNRPKTALLTQTVGEKLAYEKITACWSKQSSGDKPYRFVFFPHYLLLFLMRASSNCIVGKTPVVCQALGAANECWYRRSASVIFSCKWDRQQVRNKHEKEGRHLKRII